MKKTLLALLGFILLSTPLGATAQQKADSEVFVGANNASIYYLPGTTGWSATFANRPAVL